MRPDIQEGVDKAVPHWDLRISSQLLTFGTSEHKCPQSHADDSLLDFVDDLKFSK